MHSNFQSSGDDAKSATGGNAVRALLDRYAHSEIDLGQLETTLLSLCREDRELVWEALSFVDQYHRRRVLGVSEYTLLKQSLQKQAMRPVRGNAPAPNSPAPVATPREDLNAAPKAAAKEAHKETTGGKSLEPVLARVSSSKPESSAAAPDRSARADFIAAAIRAGVGRRPEPAAQASHREPVVVEPPRARAASAPAPAPADIVPEPEDTADTEKSGKGSIAIGIVVALVVVTAVYFGTRDSVEPPRTSVELSARPVPSAPPVEETTQASAQERSPETPHSESPPLPTPAPTRAAAAATPTKHAAVSEPVAASHEDGHTGSSAPVSISFVESNYSVADEDGVARLTVRRFGPAERELVFHWRTVDGSAKSDKDYVPYRDAEARFASGQRSIVLTVPIVSGGARKSTLWFDVELTNPTLGVIGELPGATVFLVPPG